MTLPELLSPYKPSAIAEAVGASRQAVHMWRCGASIPDVSVIPALARVLRIDLAELTEIIAADAKRLRETKGAE